MKIGFQGSGRIVTLAASAFILGGVFLSAVPAETFAQGQGNGNVGSGGSGTSTGPGNRARIGSGNENQTQFRGGFGGTTDLQSFLSSGSTEEIAKSARETSTDNCEDIGAGSSLAERFSDKNMSRLVKANDALFGGQSPELTYSSLFMLASYQIELEKQDRDLAKAGEYLGLAANKELSAEEIETASQTLCVSVSQAEAEEIRKAMR